MSGGLSFPRQQARTRRFSLGAPRKFTVSPDGERVVFLRSPAGDAAAAALWALEVASGREREVASASTILAGGAEQLSAEERARRERSRELSGGIVGYACDQDVAHAAFALDGRLWWVPLGEGAATGPVELRAAPGVVDPRPSPGGELVAFLSGPSLYAVATGGAAEAFVVAGGEGDVTWGSAEFIAAEEMDRERGFWWAPDGRLLLAERADSSEVPVWWTADPANPALTAEPHRYPVAGSTDAEVSLWLLEARAGGGARLQVRWDQARYPYLVEAHWGRGGPPLLLVEQRDHKASAVLAVDIVSGRTEVLREDTDDAWVARLAGTPAWTADGRLVWGAPDRGTWRLMVGDEHVTPAGLQVAEVLEAAGPVVFRAWSSPEVVEVWSWWPGEGLRQLTEEGGVASAVVGGGTRVMLTRSLDRHGLLARVEAPGAPPRQVANLAQVPVVEPDVRFLRVGGRKLSVGVLLPAGHEAKLPVIMAPYAGPGHQRVMADRSLWLEAQWFADQGFAVVVVDGRGVPGRGPDWERAVNRDLAWPVLEDQVDGLMGAAAEVPELDLGRVGIRGWSFGGYLAALAVLARPEVFHAAVAGAPVTDWRLYDTYYTERFLGHPAREPEAYERSSLLPLAPGLCRPLLLVHGLADDNVYAAHTLALSSRLLQAGREHSVLPLPGVTHVAGREDVAENLLVLQAEFFKKALALPATG